MKKYLFLLFLLLASPAWGETYYAKNGTQMWNTTTAWNLTASDGVGDVASVPTASTNVIFDANYTGVMYIGNSTGANYASSISALSGAAGSVIHNASTKLYIYGNVNFTNLNYSATADTSQLSLEGVAGTNNLTSAGKLLGNVYLGQYVSGRTYVLLDNLTQRSTTAIVNLFSGTLLTDGANSNSNLTHTWGSFSSSNSNTRTLTLGNSTVNVTGTGTVWATSTGTNFTMNGNTSTVIFSGNGSVTVSGGSSALNNFYNVIRQGAESKTNALVWSGSGNKVISGTLSLLGNNITNRVLVSSETLGTQRIFNATTYISDYCDFRDIAFNQSVNLSTNSSGDCGGNTNITFTPAADQHWTCADGGSWSNSSCWSGRVPLPQDNANLGIAFNASKTVTADMPRLGRTIDWTGATGSPLFDFGSVANTIYGSLDLTGLGAMVGVNVFTFEGRGNYFYRGNNLAWGVNGITIAMIGGKLTLLDAFKTDGNQIVTIDRSTNFDASAFNVTAGGFSSSNTPNGTIYMGTGFWDLKLSTAGSLWNPGATSIIDKNTSTIIISNAGNNARVFNGGFQNYNNISITGGGTGVINITGTNSWNEFKINAPKFINLTANTTQTVNSFIANGNATNYITINSTVDGTKANITDINGGRNTLSFCNLSDIQANVTSAKWWALTSQNNTLVNSTGFLTNNPTVSFQNVTVRGYLGQN